METLALMTDDWNDCSDSDVNVRTMIRKARISDRITKAIMILNTATIVMYCTGILFADVDITDQAIEVPLINKLEVPFAIKTQSMYRFVLIVEYVHMILSNWGAGIANVILLTLVSYAKSHM